MKTLKKIGLGLFLAVIGTFLVYAVGLRQHVLALCADNTPDCNVITTVSLDKSTYKFASPSVLNATIAGVTYPFTDSNPFDDNYNFKPKDKTRFCDGTLYGQNDLEDAFKGVTLNTSFDALAKGGDSLTALVNVDYLDVNGGCQNYQNTITFTKQADGSIVGLIGSPSGGGGSGSTGGAGTGGGGSGKGSCESASATSFEWLFCPILKLFDSMAKTFNDILERLLDFNVSEYLNPQVKSSWNIFKTISSAMLVIIMLIAVISQAIGGGPVDAYTLRKVLPRLVVAVIVIQISWFMLIWVIQLANDLGHGVRDLMSAPFGGYKSLDLEHLIAPIGGTGTLTITAIFTGLIIAGIFSGITIGGIALLGLTAILTDLLAFVFLVLRQVFVVLAVILFPIALLAWILPGTQRYWKLWSENFIKLLLLFPMIMAIVYGGRIFAHIFVAASAGSTSDSVIAVFVLFVGFFGPYWFLPKAFRWGGQLYGAAASGAFNATQRLREAPKGFGLKQAQANRQQRATDRYNRLSYNRARFGDRLLAAAGGFGLSRSATGVRSARNRAEGREAGAKEVEQAIVGSNYEAEDHEAKLRTLTLVAQGEFDPSTGLSGVSNPAMQRWALDQLATFGDWDRVDAVRAAGGTDERTWQSFVAKNISAIHQNAPYLSPIRRDMSQLGYQESATWKDHAVHEFERQIMTGQKRTADGRGYEDVDDSERQRQLGVDFATRALDDDRVRANLSADAVAAFERIRDLGSTQVSVGRSTAGGLQARLPSALSLESTPGARQSLTNNLMSSDPNIARATQSALGSRLADSSLDARSRAIMENYLAEMRTSAEGSNNPAAIQAYNQTLAAWQGQINQRVEQTERDAIARGMQGPAIARARSISQSMANTELARINNAGLTPI